MKKFKITLLIFIVITILLQGYILLLNSDALEKKSESIKFFKDDFEYSVNGIGYIPELYRISLSDLGIEENKIIGVDVKGESGWEIFAWGINNGYLIISAYCNYNFNKSFTGDYTIFYTD